MARMKTDDTDEEKKGSGRNVKELRKKKEGKIN
jgi:hypothetical protein